MWAVLSNSAGPALVQDGRKIVTEEERSGSPPKRPGKTKFQKTDEQQKEKL